MKKIFSYLTILILGLLVANGSLFATAVISRSSAVNVYRWATIFVVFLICLIGMVRRIATGEKLSLSSIFHLSAVFLIAISVSLSHITPIWFVIVMIVSVGLLLTEDILTKGFKWSGVVLGMCIFTPLFGIILFGNIWGFNNVLVAILAVVLMLVSSLFIGNSLENLIERKNAKRAICFAGAVVLTMLICASFISDFSYVSHIIDIVVIGLGIITIVLLVVPETFTKEQEESVSEKSVSAICGRKWGIVATALVMIFMGYSFFATISGLNVASAKISKEEFLNVVGEEFSLPIIEINTENDVFPTSKQDYVNASFSISNCKNEEHNFEIVGTSVGSSFSTDPLAFALDSYFIISFFNSSI